ncbi:MAG TPA: YbjQ family protein [Phnomibacter sp.]|nr:YbjQ family protein [Phnomibacter sp.]
MNNPKSILVTTTNSVEGLTVKQYLKPISAHIVAGTNLFSDFFASFSDVFGGRSQTYQKQLSSLYNEAIERLRIAAYEIGANCIIGLNVDLDEISGKGKSMFMLTAIGTAVIIDDSGSKSLAVDLNEKFENVGLDRIKTLQRKRKIIDKANAGTLILEDEVWDFITSNQVSEVYDFILKKLRHYSSDSAPIDTSFEGIYKRTIGYLDNLPVDKKLELLYGSILNEDSNYLADKLCGIVEELQLLDYNYVNHILKSDDFQKQKRALKLLSSDKPFYNKHDVEEINSIISFIKSNFPERGIRSMKKQLLSSKEKEIWTCECKGTSEIGSLCGNCSKDIFGFKPTEMTPSEIIAVLEEKISLINEYME